ncbi:MAG: Ig-like domain-containing protein [Bacteroidota bacterium]
MKRSLFALLAFVVVYLLQLTTLQHCATPTAPSGGARDTIGPVLVVEETTPNFQTNFKPEEIVLTFDEWVELDPQQQILISPPLELGEDNRPQLRKRSLVISLEGLELRDSVTYVVNVGAAIKDLNEGNPTENLRFVFATGPVLDSATVSGTLVEDFSGEPIEDATFTLYGNLADTAATTENPTYFAQTDEEGSFTIYNIRPGRYRAVGLLRNPSATNYYADFTGYAKPQSVGFIDTIITVADGNNSVGAVRLSPVPKPIRINAADTTAFGVLTLTLNQTANEVDLLTETTFLRRNDKDSLKLYYRDSLPPLTLVVGLDTLPADTFTYFGQGASEVGPLLLERGPPGKLNPGVGAIYRFNKPIERVDTNLITIRQDTFADGIPFRYQIDSLYPGELRFQASWLPKSIYRIELLPGAITDWVGASNQDTIPRKLNADSPESYGILNLTFTNLDSTAAYIVQLVEKEDPVPFTRRYVTETSGYQVTYRGLKPATYLVELVVDANRNGRYDAGDFLRSRQPEQVRRFEIEALRANWEVEENIDVNE